MAEKRGHSVRLARLTGSSPSDLASRPRVSFSATSSGGDRESVKLPRHVHARPQEDGEGGSEGGGSRPGSGLDISHNWMLRDALERSQKEFESRKAKLFITLPGRASIRQVGPASVRYRAGLCQVAPVTVG